ncbi:CoA protein activase [Proteinivorax hydrogeniformans]|uniref:CoA protein activase n=1 Tax=Proteinivorax hydrogeniformans TaxID=1826727 RepID=A0AAU8HQZ7_9FIRM
MGITFPRFGTSHVSIGNLLHWMGHDVIKPPKITENTIAVGTKNSPELACFPLKITTGSFIEALDNGADSILMAGGVGPCRFGYYGYLQKGALSQMGYKFDSYIIEPPARYPRQAYTTINKLRNKTPWHKVISYVYIALTKQKYLDRLHQVTLKTAPREMGEIKSFKIYEQFVKRVEPIKDVEFIKGLYDHYKYKLEKLQKIQPKARIKFLGEIYLVCEPAANLYIEEKLAKLGVEVERTIYLGEWFDGHVLKDMIPILKEKETARLAKAYLDQMVGGHGQETVAQTVKAKDQGFDGVIQVYPFTCTPEILAQGIISKVSKDKKIPVLTLSLDEHSAQAGIDTRLEAYVDLICQKKMQSEGVKLYG